jgi:hypothetical protein
MSATAAEVYLPVFYALFQQTATAAAAAANAITATTDYASLYAQASTWASIRRRLAPGGRVMTNLGAAPLAGIMGRPDPAVATTRQALAAMAEAFDGELPRHI